MSESRATPASSALSLEPFHQLAQSRPVYKNVGVVHKTQDVRYKERSSSQGSGTYDHEHNIVYTAAHCTVDDWNRDLSFYIAGESVKVKKIHRHPEYKNDFLKSTSWNDIAILELENRPSVKLQALHIEYNPFSLRYDLTAVGYGSNLTARLPSDERIRRDENNNHGFPPMQVAVKVPYCDDKYWEYYKDFEGRDNTYCLSLNTKYKILRNVIGFAPLIESKTPDRLERIKYEYLQAGLCGGFSGGALFDNRDKLVGIPVGHKFHRDEPECRPVYRYTRVSGDTDCYIPFYEHQTWIKEVTHGAKNPIVYISSVATQPATNPVKQSALQSLLCKSLHSTTRGCLFAKRTQSTSLLSTRSTILASSAFRFNPAARNPLVGIGSLPRPLGIGALRLVKFLKS